MSRVRRESCKLSPVRSARTGFPIKTASSEMRNERTHEAHCLIDSFVYEMLHHPPKHGAVERNKEPLASERKETPHCSHADSL